MKVLIIILSAVLFSQVLFTSGFAELDASTSQLVYAPGEPLFVYGSGDSNESIILRLYAPDNTVAVFEQIMTNDDGGFQHYLMNWDEPTDASKTTKAARTLFGIKVPGMFSSVGDKIADVGKQLDGAKDIIKTKGLAKGLTKVAGKTALSVVGGTLGRAFRIAGSSAGFDDGNGTVTFTYAGAIGVQTSTEPLYNVIVNHANCDITLVIFSSKNFAPWLPPIIKIFFVSLKSFFSFFWYK